MTDKDASRVLLISTYDLGHQPFGLASPAAWLASAGAKVTCLDLSIQTLEPELVSQSIMIGLFLPMHTATRLAAEIIPVIKATNSSAHLCCYGLYAPTNEGLLRSLGADSILGGEFEEDLVTIYEGLRSGEGERSLPGQRKGTISLDRQQFLVPDRGDLPELDRYASLVLPDGSRRTAGYTEATRGCKHTCRHCPIVPIYNGRFRIIQREIVLADIRQQVAAGAQHITFGDPDFLNGPGHTIPIVEAFQEEFPNLTYDVTVKVEHLIRHDDLLPVLLETGCIFITSAVEAVDDRILEFLDKGHTRADFIRTARRLRQLGLVLNPTFVAFTPWTSARGYLEMLAAIRELDLVGHVAPIQYAIRLLLPAGSQLLDLPEVQALAGEFDPASLFYPWQHPDPAMDRLYMEVFRLVQANQMAKGSRADLFAQVWQAAAGVVPESERLTDGGHSWELASKPIPRLSESWY